ncbi:hypothetical protein VTN96DRAFT_3440 [Rasamsonia emersonii]
MSYNRPDVNRGPSTSGSIHPLPSPASTASYLFPQGSGLPLQSWQSQQSRYEEPYSPRSQAPLEYRIPSRPSLSDYQLPSPATSSRHSISSSSTYSAYQPDHGTWRQHSVGSPYSSMQVDHKAMSVQHSDREISPQRPGAGGKLFASGNQDSPEMNATSYHVTSNEISNQKHRTSSSGIPLGFERLLHPQSPPPQSFPLSPQPSPPVTASRFRLHIRQQPVAGRACAAGEKDRRPIDPPPILQLLIVDFDPDSENDRLLLQDPRFAVGCLLYSVTGSWFIARMLSSPLRKHRRPVPQGTAMRALEGSSNGDRFRCSLEGRTCPRSTLTRNPIQPPLQRIHPAPAERGTQYGQLLPQCLPRSLSLQTSLSAQQACTG